MSVIVRLIAQLLSDAYIMYFLVNHCDVYKTLKVIDHIMTIISIEDFTVKLVHLYNYCMVVVVELSTI